MLKEKEERGSSIEWNRRMQTPSEEKGNSTVGRARPRGEALRLESLEGHPGRSNTHCALE